MSPLAGTKRPAESPVASPTKAAAYTKRSRTHYDYFDEEDAEDMQWSGDDWSDDSSVMDLDDADEIEDNQERLSPDDLGDDDLDDKAGRSWSKHVRRLVGCSKKARQDTDAREQVETDDAALEGIPVSRCRCKSSSCRDPSLCGDPLDDLDTEAVFGPGEVTLHPCFIHHLAHNEAIVPAWLTTQDLFELVYDSTCLVPGQDTGVIAEWHAKWTVLSKRNKEEEPGIALQRELLRLALTCTPGNDMFYSFCFHDECNVVHEDSDGPWRATAATGHCRTCGRCAKQYDCHSPGNHVF